MNKRFPDFNGMGRVTGEIGKRSGRILIVMPFHNKFDYLDKHLELLKKQTYRRFDLLIVGSSACDERAIERAVMEKKPDFAVLIVKRFEDNGAAGGFYAGEMFALEKDYEAVILAEEDALPTDSALVETLVGQAGRGSEVVIPTCIFVIGEVEVFRAEGIHFYSLITREALVGAGPHCPHIYLGGEDAEFAARLPKFARVGATLTHPAWLSVFGNFERNVGYRINYTVFTAGRDIVNYLYTFGVIIPAYMVFGVGLAREAGAHMLSSLLRRRYGKDAIFTKGKAAMGAGNSIAGAIVPVPMPGCGMPQYVIGKPGTAPGFMRFIFRRSVLFFPVKNPYLFMGMALAKELWIETPAGRYMLAENRNPTLHAAKLVVFCVLSISMLSLGLIAWPYMALLKPGTVDARPRRAKK